MTRMPAVRIELGYLTNPEDCRKILDPTFRGVFDARDQVTNCEASDTL